MLFDKSILKSSVDRRAVVVNYEPKNTELKPGKPRSARLLRLLATWFLRIPLCPFQKWRLLAGPMWASRHF